MEDLVLKTGQLYLFEPAQKAGQELEVEINPTMLYGSDDDGLHIVVHSMNEVGKTLPAGAMIGYLIEASPIPRFDTDALNLLIGRENQERLRNDPPYLQKEGLSEDMRGSGELSLTPGGSNEEKSSTPPERVVDHLKMGTTEYLKWWGNTHLHAASIRPGCCHKCDATQEESRLTNYRRIQTSRKETIPQEDFLDRMRKVKGGDCATWNRDLKSTSHAKINRIQVLYHEGLLSTPRLPRSKPKKGRIPLVPLVKPNGKIRVALEADLRSADVKKN